MPIFSLDNNNISFPPIEVADSSGLLAVGGMLDVEWLLEAYSVGVFPWFNEDEPVMWWSPNPRSVVFPGEVKISRSMRSCFRSNKFELRIDTSFENVIENCQKIVRKNQEGTWITRNMKSAYLELHELGYAHSFETWENNVLVGGLYGISFGKMFFGESMFSHISNASKFAFISLSEILNVNNFILIDCQVPNSHLEKMGCFEMKRMDYKNLLEENEMFETVKGDWGNNLINLQFSI